MKGYLTVLKKYAAFGGRASFNEFWGFYFINLLFYFGLKYIDKIIGGVNENGYGLLANVYSLAILIPSIAVTVRRLHDIGLSGWWIITLYVPAIGLVLLIFLMGQGVDQLIGIDIGKVLDKVLVLVGIVTAAFFVSMTRKSQTGVNQYGVKPEP